jgi:uncharacterized damage-inducible protein DinB
LSPTWIFFASESFIPPKKPITMSETNNQIISKDQLLAHWQGHRGLTRRLIEAFPEEALFNHSIGGMRTFAGMVGELLGIAGPGTKGMATGDWSPLEEHPAATTKEQLLKLWDEATEEINTYWPQIPEAFFQDDTKVFGQYDGKAYSSILYFIDNEIHHRGQGYVYLRSLGVEPPPFWDR